MYHISLDLVWKAAFADAFVWVSDPLQQEALAFTILRWNYKGLLMILVYNQQLGSIQIKKVHLTCLLFICEKYFRFLKWSTSQSWCFASQTEEGVGKPIIDRKRKRQTAESWTEQFSWFAAKRKHQLWRGECRISTRKPSVCEPGSPVATFPWCLIFDIRKHRELFCYLHHNNDCHFRYNWYSTKYTWKHLRCWNCFTIPRWWCCKYS